MAFDLGQAMRRKAEVDSARLTDFGFRRRARAARLTARALDIDAAEAASLVATCSEAQISDALAEMADVPLATAEAEYHRWSAIAHQQLVAERGDPTPHRLA